MDATAPTLANLASALRKVAWMNVWNWTHTGGHGSRVHLTRADGRSGETLCGRTFPVEKGHPIMVYVCKKCWKAAAITNAEFAALSYVD